MIFVTVGTHPQQFNRLLMEVDSLVAAGKIKDVFAQTGNSDYVPKNYKCKKMLSLAEFDEKMKSADLIITHGGEGGIGNALQLRKRMVIVPRLKKFNEHTNDHQLELTKAVADAGWGIAVDNIAELGNAIEKAKKLNPGNYEKGHIIELIEEFVEQKFAGAKNAK
jgi:UDP-N-acetylglucosamine transferase subunit ALG13